MMSSTVCLSVCPRDYFLLPQPPPRILYVQAAREHAAAAFKQAFGSREKRNVFSLDLKTATESLLRTVFDSKFQTAGTEHRKVRFANAVVVKG